MIDFFHGSCMTVARWLSAVGLIILAAWIAQSVGSFGIIFCLPFLIVATLLTLRDLVRPFTWMVDVLFGTGPGHRERPPIDLRLARHYVDQERFEEALEEYARVMKWHPRISEPYEQSMRLLARSSGDRKDIERIFRRGLRWLRSADLQADLESAHREALTLLASGGTAAGIPSPGARDRSN